MLSQRKGAYVIALTSLSRTGGLMPDENRDGYRTPAGREKALDEHGERLDLLEDRVTVVEVKEAGRAKKADRATAAVVALAVAIASGVAVALLVGGHP